MSIDNFLEEESLRDWLESIDSGLSAKADYLEALETWVAKDEEVQEYIKKWGDVLVNQKGRAQQILSDENYPLIIKILAYLQIKKALRLVEMSGRIQPGLSGDLLKCAQENIQQEDFEAEAKLFVARIKHLVRLQYYERLFGPERRKTILKILEEEKAYD